jgi:hypothetical protein
MNENLELLFQEIENNPENLLMTLVTYGECTQESDVEASFNDWLDATETLLRNLRRIASKNNLNYSVEIIDDTLDNLRG